MSSGIGAEVKLYIKTELFKFSELNKKDRHEQNQKIQNIINKQDDKMDKILDKTDKLYAKKWVEKAWWGIIVMVFSALGTALMTLIIK